LLNRSEYENPHKKKPSSFSVITDVVGVLLAKPIEKIYESYDAIGNIYIYTWNPKQPVLDGDLVKPASFNANSN